MTHGPPDGYNPDAFTPPPDRPRGRPAKGYENLHCEVTPTASEIITKVAAAFDLSKGEAVSMMAVFFRDNLKEKLNYNK